MFRAVLDSRLRGNDGVKKFTELFFQNI